MTGTTQVESADATVLKVLRRLVPFAMLLMLLSLLDRTNISIAALQMNADFGFTPAVYGVAAGIFFIGYFVFEVPSNVVLVRVGARPWLTRIMITCGIVVLCMAWIRGVRSLYALRLLLGVAEAGLLPGLLLYLSRWVPARQLGTAYSLLMSTTAVANVVGGPIAGALLRLDGAFGLRGWQLIFIAEGLPTLALGCAIARYLPERPRDAAWLNGAERAWLAARIEREDEAKIGRGVTTFRGGFFDRRVITLTVAGFLFVCCNFGTVFWLPQIIGSWGQLGPLQIGFLAGLPYLLGGLGTVVWARHSDRTSERRWHLVSCALLATLGYTIAALLRTPAAAFVALCVATVGIWSVFGVFWAHAGNLLGAAAAAGGLAVINSFSTLGGLVGPALMGFARDRTHDFRASLLLLAGFALLAGVASLWIRNTAVAIPADSVGSRPGAST